MAMECTIGAISAITIGANGCPLVPYSGARHFRSVKKLLPISGMEQYWKVLYLTRMVCVHGNQNSYTVMLLAAI